MRIPKRLKVFAGLAAVVLLLVGWTEATRARYGPHSSLDMAMFRSSEDGLVVLYSTYFATAGRCSGCHGHDTNALAMVTPAGVDVNVVDDWRSTMMGNSARDPFFKAKVSHEGLVNPGERIAIENKCLGCHAPLGMHEEEMLGHPPFDMAMLDTSTIGKDGVSCLACHQQQPDSAGHFFSGRIHFGPETHHQGDNSARVYGPYPDDEINAAIMTFFVGFRPGQGPHILDGRVCAGCHSLITETHDLAGNPTGGEFVEQATWHEWLNSEYPNDPGTTCRGCHMPRIEDSIVLASEYAFLSGHRPFGLHHLAGGNAFMLRLLKANRLALGIPASDTQFDSTIARTLRNLRSSVTLDVSMVDRTADTAYVDVSLVDRIGHKFPSGYPSRRAFVQVIAMDADGDTLFQSGRWDDSYELIGHDAGYEPHHDVITQGDQVQIYEMVMGDVNGDVTTTLERAATPLKDNRLVPHGFSTLHPSYDTAMIAGVPPGDIDFNHNALGIEGNAGDVVHYHLPLNGYPGAMTVHARIYYQPVPPLWNQEMFGFHSAAIDTFRNMYAQAEGTPELVDADSLFDTGLSIDARWNNAPRVFPNPARDGIVSITGVDIRSILLFDAAGRRLAINAERGPSLWRLRLPEDPGVYHVLVSTTNGERLLRVVRSAP